MITADDIKSRITISLPDRLDRVILSQIMNRYGASKAGGIRIALREYAINHDLRVFSPDLPIPPTNKSN